MPTGFDTANELLANLRRIVHIMERHSKKLKAGFGVTGPQFVILNEINKNPNITTKQLTEKVSLSQSTVTNILERLEERALISRVRDTQDKRKWFLSLTQAGYDVFNNKPSLFRTKFIDDFIGLPTSQQDQILSSLQHLAVMLE